MYSPLPLCAQLLASAFIASGQEVHIVEATDNERECTRPDLTPCGQAFLGYQDGSVTQGYGI